MFYILYGHRRSFYSKNLYNIHHVVLHSDRRILI
jgi:hypothetical protein